MTRFRKLPSVTAVWAAALTLLLAVPASARAQDCMAEYIQCWVDHGSSTQCLHDYIQCITRIIVHY
jgi:hypothetical protein